MSTNSPQLRWRDRYGTKQTKRRQCLTLEWSILVKLVDEISFLWKTRCDSRCWRANVDKMHSSSRPQTPIAQQWGAKHWNTLTLRVSFKKSFILNRKWNAHQYECEWRCSTRSAQNWHHGQSTMMRQINFFSSDHITFVRMKRKSKTTLFLQVLIRPIDESNANNKRRCVVALVPVCVFRCVPLYPGYVFYRASGITHGITIWMRGLSMDCENSSLWPKRRSTTVTVSSTPRHLPRS